MPFAADKCQTWPRPGYTTTLLVPVSDQEKKPLMARHKHGIDVLKYIQFFYSRNIQILFNWERKVELNTSYHVRLIS